MRIKQDKNCILVTWLILRIILILFGELIDFFIQYLMSFTALTDILNRLTSTFNVGAIALLQIIKKEMKEERARNNM